VGVGGGGVGGVCGNTLRSENACHEEYVRKKRFLPSPAWRDKNLGRQFSLEETGKEIRAGGGGELYDEVLNGKKVTPT